VRLHRGREPERFIIVAEKPRSRSVHRMHGGGHHAVAAGQQRPRGTTSSATILLAERGSWPAAMIRPAFAAPFVIYVWKVVVYDKVLGLGTTDAITGAVGDWAGWIITAYFVSRPIEKMARGFVAGRR